tara:strand:+ start:223 stop:822 length:600 start_codon:yes stop_codon:yes gene_type:complete
MAFGSVYTRKAQTKLKRHAFDTSLTVSANTHTNLSLLSYSTAADVAVSGQTDQFTSLYVQEGSKVRKYWLDLTIIPSSNTVVQDIYIGWVALSRHDIEDSPIDLVKNASTKRIENPSSASAFQISTFRVDPKNKHYVRRMKKITLYGGRPAVASRWLMVPARCRRSEEGMYWGLFIGNSSGTDITVKVSRAFNEYPIVD